MNIIKKNSLENKVLLNSIKFIVQVAWRLRSSQSIIVSIIFLKKNIILNFFKKTKLCFYRLLRLHLDP
jgi:hypothetical protein